MDGIVSSDDVMGGEPRIEGRRIAVRHIAEEVELADRSASGVAVEYSLEISQVYRALVYYHENSEEITDIREDIKERERAAIDKAVTAPDDGGTRTTPRQ